VEKKQKKRKTTNCLKGSIHDNFLAKILSVLAGITTQFQT